MPFRPLVQCDKSLSFQPRARWPDAFPAMCWQGLLLSGFERKEGQALDLWETRRCTWLEALTACHRELGLGELARLYTALGNSRPELAQEFSASLFSAYDLRWSDRLAETLKRLCATPLRFQNLVDEKKWGVRDLAPLLALKDVREISQFLQALCEIELSKSSGAQALELVTELYLLGRPLNDLLPATNDGAVYMKCLLQWRKPHAALNDEQMRQTVSEWPWPAQVQGHWQRFGDQAGIEIKIRTFSPQDLGKKLERLSSIHDTWSCKS